MLTTTTTRIRERASTKSYNKDKTNFEDDTSRLNLDQQKLDDAYAELWINLWVPQVEEFLFYFGEIANQRYLAPRNQKCLDLQGNVLQMPVSIL